MRNNHAILELRVLTPSQSTSYRGAAIWETDFDRISYGRKRAATLKIRPLMFVLLVTRLECLQISDLNV